MVSFGTLCGGTMNLVINYDFMEAVLNVREPFHTSKVIRNKKTKWKVVDLPLFVGFTLIDPKRVISNALIISSYIGIEIATYHIIHAMTKEDSFLYESSYHLKLLASQLQELNISTDYELLLQSDLYKKEKKLDLKNHQLLENKYMMVPTYNFNGEVKDTSILQEHVVGSREYVLSLGSFKKSFQPSYSNI